MAEKIIESTKFKKINDLLLRDMERTVEEIKTISTIPSPSFFEDEKAEYVKERFEELGLSNIRIDKLKNVIGVLKGESSLNFVICAHIDTVFEKDTELVIKEKDGRIYCPSIGDNSTSVAGMLALIRALREASFVPSCNLVFIANSCEEGLGDLKGIKHYFENEKVSAMVSIDGTMEKLVNQGIGSRRYKITVNSEGGHSWSDFGNESAIHTMGKVISKIAGIDVPEKPKTTFNVGVISGGTSINTIAEEAQMLLDIRSEESGQLKKTEDEIINLIEGEVKKNDSFCSFDVVGDRPSGKIAEDHFMVRSVFEAAELLDIPMELVPSSTDSNIPLSKGIASVTFGIYTGGGAHTVNEYIEPESLKKGLPLLALSVLTMLKRL